MGTMCNIRTPGNTEVRTHMNGLCHLRHTHQHTRARIISNIQIGNLQAQQQPSRSAGTIDSSTASLPAAANICIPWYSRGPRHSNNQSCLLFAVPTAIFVTSGYTQHLNRPSTANRPTHVALVAAKTLTTASRKALQQTVQHAEGLRAHRASCVNIATS